MSSAEGPVVYWCHQCNAQTCPPVAEDVLCTICHQGFVEELSDAEVEPGVPFSALPLHFSSFLGRPSLPSVEISRDRSTTGSPSSGRQQIEEQVPPLQNRRESLRHRPRILRRQVSGVPALFEALMQGFEETNALVPAANRSASGDSPEVSETDQLGSGQPTVSNPGSEAEPESAGLYMGNRGHIFAVSPTLILHGIASNGFGSLEVFVDHGQGAAPTSNHMGDYFFGSDLDRLIDLLAENDQSRYGTPPAAKAEVEQLPKIKVREEHLGSELWSECAVCKDSFDLDGEAMVMPCKHMYHPHCIVPWLEQHNSCPICRFELPTEDADYEARKRQMRSTTENASSAERRESRRPYSAAGEESAPPDEDSPGNARRTSGQSTLWGMPSMSFDMSRFLSPQVNPFTRSDDYSNDGQQVETEQEQGAPRDGGTRRDGISVQRLFDLFSSGSLPSQDNDRYGGNQSPDGPSGREAAPNS